MSGNGRVILTASSGTEEAWEHARLRHGLLTYRVIEALLGAPDVIDGTSIRLFRILEYVTRSVVDDALSIGRKQRSR